MNHFPKKLILLGSGELGKEICIAAKRIGCFVIACDKYAGAPAMQIADISEVLDMTNKEKLKSVILKYNPDIVIPEIEALSISALEEIESNGIVVIPNARATSITMNRDQIRDLANKTLGLQTAGYNYAKSEEEMRAAAKPLGYPVIVKPVMSSSGKGQSLVQKEDDLEEAWKIAIAEARGNVNKVIIEEFINFDYEITLLTIRQKDGSTLFCDPIGHEQKGGDYQCSWQPAEMNSEILKKAQVMATKITEELGGEGLFGVEFFVSAENVIFSELSPRPHDTGLVTLITQNINEFELHLRAILGLPIPSIKRKSAGASRVILANDNFQSIAFEGLDLALSQANTKVLLFGKPNAIKGRRMGVALATSEKIKEARKKADESAKCIRVIKGN